MTKISSIQSRYARKAADARIHGSKAAEGREHAQEEVAHHIMAKLHEMGSPATLSHSSGSNLHTIKWPAGPNLPRGEIRLRSYPGILIHTSKLASGRTPNLSGDMLASDETVESYSESVLQQISDVVRAYNS